MTHSVVQGDYMTKYGAFEGTNLTAPKKATSGVHMLPPEDPSFKWRVRVDLRAAIDAPLNRTPPGGLPSCYCEFGWSLYENTEPDEYTRIMSVLIESNRHPHWNQQLLFNNPSEVLDLSKLTTMPLLTSSPDGFFWITLRDRHSIEPIERFSLPLFVFKAF